MVNEIEVELASFLKRSGAQKYVIGLSGGLDSSTAVTLAVQAVGGNRVTGLFMADRRVTPRGDVRDGAILARKLGIKTYRVEVSRILSAYSQASPFYSIDAKIANGNLRARVRMSLLYYYANLENALVLGTGDRSEILIGYFTKYGDGGTDVLPLGDLYKTQVRMLAEFLALPTAIVSKPSSPRLWIGHTAREELGLDYDVIDLILFGFFDLKLSKRKLARELDLPTSTVSEFLERCKFTEHKRSPPPVIHVRNQA